MKYLCVIYAGHGPAVSDAAENSAIKDACIEEDLALFAAGRLVLASPLQGPQTAVSMRYRNGRAIRSDGPYAETKEWIAGFMVIEAADVEEAVAMLADGALAGLADFEVRPLLDETHSKTGQDRSALFRRG
ncbi:MAG: YciI family protein [Devosia sp.]